MNTHPPLATHLRKKFALSLVLISALSACGGGGTSAIALEQAAAVSAAQFTDTHGVVQPAVDARIKPILKLGQFSYRDLNSNGKLDQYENWRLPAFTTVLLTPEPA